MDVLLPNILTKSSWWEYWARKVTNKRKNSKASANLESLSHIGEYWARWIRSVLLKGRIFLSMKCFFPRTFWSFQELFRTFTGKRVSQIATFCQIRLPLQKFVSLETVSWTNDWYISPCSFCLQNARYRNLGKNLTCISDISSLLSQCWVVTATLMKPI